jgi:HAD superfamily hydrolase (TIGR01509 family)
MEQIKLVIFDMDGLLFDTERPSYLAMKEILENEGYEFLLDHYRQLIGLTTVNSNQVLQKLYGNEFQFESLRGAYHKRFSEILDTDGLMIKPGAEQLLNAIERKGLKKCIASSSSRETIERYLKKAGLESRFDLYVSGHEVKRGKPHPDIFLEACKRVNETPESAIVLEDSLNGLKAAYEANIHCILVPDLIEPNDEIKEKAFAIVTDLEEVINIIGL